MGGLPVPKAVCFDTGSGYKRREQQVSQRCACIVVIDTYRSFLILAGRPGGLTDARQLV